MGDTKEEAERLDAVDNLDHISILDPKTDQVREIIRAKDFFRRDGEYRVSRGLCVCGPPKIYLCGSRDEMLKKIAED